MKKQFNKTLAGLLIFAMILNTPSPSFGIQDLLENVGNGSESIEINLLKK